MHASLRFHACAHFRRVFYCDQTYYNLTAYTSCLPGVSQVYLTGNYMYDM